MFMFLVYNKTSQKPFEQKQKQLTLKQALKQPLKLLLFSYINILLLFIDLPYSSTQHIAIVLKRSKFKILDYMKQDTSLAEYGSYENFFEEQQKKATTSAETKLFNYIKKLLEDPSFRNELDNVRKTSGIPENGFKRIYINKKYKTKKFKHLKTPEELGYEFDNKKFNQAMDNVFEKYGISEGLAGSWTTLLRSIVLYNSYEFEDYYSTYGSMVYGMIDVIDLSSMLSQNYEDEPAEDRINLLEEYTDSKPVAILINPYATQRDILDFVKKLYKTSISPILNSYKKNDIALGKKRKSNDRTENRNRLIYENRHLPKKELIHLVSKEYKEVLEQSYLNTIIRKEKEKRK